MVVYGDPMTLKRAREKNHGVAALAAALEVHHAIEAMNERWQQRGDPPFEVGIGCCSGVVAIGVLGADTAHLQYTVIGDVTNTAARVQGLSRDLSAPVICAESTIERAGDRVVSERIKAVPLKGKAKPVTVYRVLGLSGDQATIERMRAQTEGGPTEPAPVHGGAVVSTLLACLLGFALLASGCAGSPTEAPSPGPLSISTPAPAAPSKEAEVPTASPERPLATVMPVGTPQVVQTVRPSMGGPRVTYANPLPAAAPSPRSPLLGGPSPPATSPAPGKYTPGAMEDLTLPIYPNATKKTQVSQGIPTARHLILVLDTTDSCDLVKSWYKSHMKANAVVDTGSDADKTRKIELSRASVTGDKDLMDTVVIQPMLDGTTQVLLAEWRPLAP
jgi:hypothetical protein